MLVALVALLNVQRPHRPAKGRDHQRPRHRFDGDADRQYSVIVFATDRSKWSTASRFLRLARPAEDGSFEVASLPPGEYWVAAVDPVDGTDVSGDWLKPESLEKLSFRARRVTLAERERHMTVLRLIR